MIPDLTNPYLSNGSLSPGARTVSCPCSLLCPLHCNPLPNPPLSPPFPHFSSFWRCKETEREDGCLRNSKNLHKKFLVRFETPFPSTGLLQYLLLCSVWGVLHTQTTPATQTLPDFDSFCSKVQIVLFFCDLLAAGLCSTAHSMHSLFISCRDSCFALGTH